MLSRHPFAWSAARATVSWLVFIICAQQAAATPSGSNSCLAEFGDGSCSGLTVGLHAQLFIILMIRSPVQDVCTLVSLNFV